MMVKRKTRFVGEPTELCYEALVAMRRLYFEEGIDSLHRAYASVVHEEILKHYKERLGLKETYRSDFMKRLTGTTNEFPPYTDHPVKFNKNGKPHSLISQPYPLDMSYMKEIIGYCEQNNLTFCVSCWSWHFPGSTILIEFTKKKIDTSNNVIDMETLLEQLTRK
jgi:hypothetical protein